MDLHGNKIILKLQVFVCVLAVAAVASAGFLGGGGGGGSGGGGGWNGGGGGKFSPNKKKKKRKEALSTIYQITCVSIVPTVKKVKLIISNMCIEWKINKRIEREYLTNNWYLFKKG